VQEVKLQNTEGDDFDAKIDKMVSQAEDNLASSQLSRLKELLKRRVYGLSVGLKTHKVGLPSWKKHLGTSSGP
jgi:hypothetical protein